MPGAAPQSPSRALAEPSRSVWQATGQRQTQHAQHSIAQHTAQHNTQHSTAQHSTPQHTAAHRSTPQHTAANNYRGQIRAKQQQEARSKTQDRAAGLALTVIPPPPPCLTSGLLGLGQEQIQPFPA
ncbi:per-pentamer repeat protein [Ceratocystis lukuohia]|uniref:Per-pentamer repeat protein n=1 Tax=Ceratocystis lukuohia TaxID=2019550 RepID=A0ABR4MKI6_9PEZI